MVDSTKILSASNAYRQANIRPIDTSPLELTQKVSSPTKPDFSDMVGAVVNDAINSTRRAEVAGTKAMMNQISLDDLAVAVSNAELTLKAITAIRDRVVNAYQDIIKMPI